MTDKQYTTDEMIADGIEKIPLLAEDFADELTALVTKYSNLLTNMSFLELGTQNEKYKEIRKEKTTDNSLPGIVRSRFQGYLNVLAGITKPIRHDSSFYSSMMLDMLHTIEDSPHYERAKKAYFDALDKRKQRQ